MSRHWRPDGGRRDWARASGYGVAGAPRLTGGARAALILAGAAGLGMAAGLSLAPAPAPPVETPAEIQWDEVQAAPKRAPDAKDAAWEQRANGENRPSTGSGRAVGAPRANTSLRPGSGQAGSGPVFGLCHGGGGRNCVVDGDTFYLGGAKVRIAGIDAPETHPPRCAQEAQLGEAATEKLRALLNSGAVTMTSIDRDRDQYGRLLRNVAVDGADVGAAMVGAGVARDYAGGKRGWC